MLDVVVVDRTKIRRPRPGLPRTIHGKHRFELHRPPTVAHVYKVNVNISGYGLVGAIRAIHFSLIPPPRDALASAFSDPTLRQVYTDNASAPFNVHAGLRQLYMFGLYSHCAYVNETAGSCTSTSSTYRFQPSMVIINDVPSNYSGYAEATIRGTAFANSSWLGRSSVAARRLLLVGCIMSPISVLAFVRSHQTTFGLGSLTFVPPSGAIAPHTPCALLVAALTTVIASISVLAGSAIWATIIQRVGDINTQTVQSTQVPLGIVVSAGTGLQYAWASFGLLVASVIDCIILSVPFCRLTLTIPGT